VRVTRPRQPLKSSRSTLVLALDPAQIPIAPEAADSPPSSRFPPLEVFVRRPPVYVAPASNTSTTSPIFQTRLVTLDGSDDGGLHLRHGLFGLPTARVSSNERVRGLWLVTRNKITGGPPLFNLFGGKPSARGSHNKKRNSLPQSNLRASQRANPLSHACGQELPAKLSHETEKRRLACIHAVSALSIGGRCRPRNRCRHHFGIMIGLEPIVTEILAVGFYLRLIGRGRRRRARDRAILPRGDCNLSRSDTAANQQHCRAQKGARLPRGIRRCENSLFRLALRPATSRARHLRFDLAVGMSARPR
jgi:hypothetical protein